jgi:hypothetical protein
MKKTSFQSLYSFPGFRALATLKESPDDPEGRIIVLRRRQKKQPAPVVILKRASTIELPIGFGTSMPVASVSIWSSSTAGCAARGAMP